MTTYNTKNTKLQNIAVMICRNVSKEELPDDLQDELDMNGIEWPNNAYKYVYQYLTDSVQEHLFREIRIGSGNLTR